MAHGNGRRTMRQWMRWTVVTWVFGALLGALGASAQSTDQPSIWVADAGGLVEVRRSDQAVLLDIAASLDARAVAVDRQLNLVWTVAGGTLRSLGSTGEATMTVPLLMPPGAPVCLEVDEDDGSAWVGVGKTVWGYAYWGELQQELEFDRPVMDLHVSPVDGRLWVVQPGAVIAIDRASGREELRLAHPGVASASVNPITGQIWVAIANELIRYSAEGEEELRVPRRGLRALLAESSGAVWGLRGNEVVRIDEEGEEISSFTPFALPQSPRRLRRDPATGNVWVASRNGLLRISPSGIIQEALDLGLAADLRDVAPGRAPLDDEGPRMRILAPTAGESLEKLRPEIRVSYSDSGAGVDPKTFYLRTNSLYLPAACVHSSDGAVCTPEADLPLGTVYLVAGAADYLENDGAAPGITFTVSDPREPGDDPGAGLEDPDPEGSGVTPAYYSAVPADRGLKANEIYMADGEIETISTSDGNLTISIPLGPTYSVGPKIRYQFRLVHNSNIWQDIGINCSSLGPCSSGSAGDVHFLASVPNSDQNAGLGWALHFGKLYAPIAPSGLSPLERRRWPNQLNSLTSTWLYVDPDGTSHQFHVLTNRPGTTGNTFYTSDGSYMRLQTDGANWMKVERPDGVISYFEKVDDFEGTEFCGGGVNGCWRFSHMKDPYDNQVSVDYTIQGNFEKWTVRDSARFGVNDKREHNLIFRIDNAKTAGGDGVAPLRTPDGDQWGDLRRLLTQVDVEAVGGERLKYNLSHSPQVVDRGRVKHAEKEYQPQRTLRIPVLNAIRALDVNAYLGWNFETDTGGTNRCGLESGQLCEIRLPSRGKLRYTYRNWSFPTQCDYKLGEPSPIDSYTKLGVATKSRIQAGGGFNGSWVYTPFLEGSAPWSTSHPDCSRETTRRTVVDSPVENSSFTRQVFYHAIAVVPPTGSPASTPVTEWQGTEKGLPFTKEIVDDANYIPGSPGHPGGSTFFLSRQVYDCPSSGLCDVNKLDHSVFVRYAMEWPRNCRSWLGDTASCKGNFATLVAERTVYHDDERASGGSPRYNDRFFTKQTGLGYAREVIANPAFDRPGLTLPTETTEVVYLKGTTLGVNATTGYYNVGNPRSWTPGTSQPWILGPSSRTTRRRGTVAYVTETEFDNEGELVCQRRWKNASARSAKDVVTRFERGDDETTNAGLVIKEIHAGGDDAGLSTSIRCSTMGSAAAGTRHEVEHTYDAHQLETSEILPVNTFPFLYQVDADPWTGLVTTEFSISDQPTVLTYDLLGRLTTVTPDASLREAKTFLTHSISDLELGSVKIERKDGSTSLSWAKTEFDSFGRPLFERRRRPDTDGTIATSMRRYDYHKSGDLRYLTTWQDEDAFNAAKRTEYRHYDPLGRPRYVIAPNQVETEHIYFGVSKVEVEEEVAALAQPFGWQREVKRKTFFDGSGRVVRESTPIQTTTYTLDPMGNVTEALRGTQERKYNFDGRGFLTSEEHPELGAQNALTGTIAYDRDVLGNARSKTGSGWSLDFDYDQAFRLVEVATGNQIWETFAYSSANNTSSNNYSKGKLITASRYNYPIPFNGDPRVGDPTKPWMVREHIGYGGRLGQVSSRRTQLHFLANPAGQQVGEEFAQSWLYDGLGRVTRTIYPACDAALCNDGNDTPAAAHRSNLTWVQGLVTKVSSDQGIGANYNYYDNFQPRENRYNSQLHFISGRGPNGMAIPNRFRVRSADAAVTKWDSGFYRYDGAQNIRRIGENYYAYDDSQRLKNAQLKAKWSRTGAPTTHSEIYTYDQWDNMLTKRRDGGGAISYTYSQTGYQQKNRLLHTAGHVGPPDIAYDQRGSVERLGIVPGGTAAAQEISYDGLGMPRREVIRPSTALEMEHVYFYGPGNLRFMRLEKPSFPANSPYQRQHMVRDLSGKVLRTWTGEGFGPQQEVDFEQDYVFGPEGLFASKTVAGAVKSYFKDHLGTPRVVSSGPKESGGFHNYYPFGDEIQNAATFRDDRFAKFTGHERDAHGRSDYMLARSYGFEIQRFLTVDPARDGWNLYAYVGNSPIMYNDPRGRRQNPVTGLRGIDSRPKNGASGRIRSNSRNSRVGKFGYTRTAANGSKKFHSGVDINAANGSQLLAAEGGTVADIGKRGAAGNRLQITTADGTTLSYAHLDEFKNGLKKGSSVLEGEVIGTAGSTGNAGSLGSGEEHVHFTVIDSAGNRIDPESWLNDPAASDPVNSTDLVDFSSSCNCSELAEDPLAFSLN